MDFDPNNPEDTMPDASKTNNEHVVIKNCPQIIYLSFSQRHVFADEDPRDFENYDENNILWNKHRANYYDPKYIKVDDVVWVLERSLLLLNGVDEGTLELKIIIQRMLNKINHV